MSDKKRKPDRPAEEEEERNQEEALEKLPDSVGQMAAHIGRNPLKEMKEAEEEKREENEG